MFDFASVPLDEKYIEDLKQSSLNFGILKLSGAVLEQALLDIRYGHDVDRVLRWMENPGDEYIFSFLAICRTLNLNQMQIRAAIKSYISRSSSAGRADAL